MIFELFACLSSLFKEVGAEPNLFQMSLMGILGENLFNSYFAFGGAMHT